MWRNAGRFAVASPDCGSHEDDDTSESSTVGSDTSDTDGGVSVNMEGESDDACDVEPDMIWRTVTRRTTKLATREVSCDDNSHLESPLKLQLGGTPRDVAAVQSLWQQYARTAAGMYPKSLWGVLHAVKWETKTTQNAVLQACQQMLSSKEKKLWPTTRKTMDRSITRKLGSFHVRVMRQVRIDLSRHNLPELESPIVFSFLDPVFVWATIAHRLSFKHKLHFSYQKMVHPTTGARLYGASVAHGEVMREACLRCPTAPALFGIGYDSGQASRRRSYTPILVSVGNTDYMGMESCMCIGYMPDIIGPYRDTVVAKLALHELRQTVIGAIVDIIEACAQHGFVCLLRSTDGYVPQHI